MVQREGEGEEGGGPRDGEVNSGGARGVHLREDRGAGEQGSRGRDTERQTEKSEKRGMEIQRISIGHNESQ